MKLYDRMDIPSLSVPDHIHWVMKSMYVDFPLEKTFNPLIPILLTVLWGTL